MLTLPNAIVAVVIPFATLFTNPTWQKAQLLLVDTILTPGQRTVAAALRVMGRSNQRDYARYHEVLNRAVWSSRAAARVLLLLLQHLDCGDGPLIFGIDETLERRRGAKIRGAGHPSRPHRSLVLVGDNGYAVLDLLHCCQSLREPVTLIVRLRLDAALYAPAPPRQPGQNGRPALKGPRGPSLKTLLDHADVTWASVSVDWYDGTTRIVELTSQTAVWYRSGKPPVTIRWVLIRDPQNTFDPQALHCTDPSTNPTQILEWFVLRWQLEVTFQEVRTHLGVETQRRWSDLAIARTTPVLLGLFSWTTLAAHPLQNGIASPSALRPGTTNRRRPSWTPSPWCLATCGWRRRVSHCRSLTPTLRNSRWLCTTEWWIPSPTPLENAESLEKVHAGINAERVNNGGPALKWDDGLASIARAHSDDMTNRNYFSYDTPEGMDPTDRLHRAGLNCRKGYRYGIAENIAMETSLGNMQQTATEAVRGWMNSPGHRRNLLSREYSTTGVGASFGTWQGYKSVYLTQVFC